MYFANKLSKLKLTKYESYILLNLRVSFKRDWSVLSVLQCYKSLRRYIQIVNIFDVRFAYSRDSPRLALFYKPNYSLFCWLIWFWLQLPVLFQTPHRVPFGFISQNKYMSNVKSRSTVKRLKEIYIYVCLRIYAPM